MALSFEIDFLKIIQFEKIIKHCCLHSVLACNFKGLGRINGKIFHLADELMNW